MAKLAKSVIIVYETFFRFSFTAGLNKAKENKTHTP